MKKVFIGITLLCIGMGANAQNKNFLDQPYIEVNGSADTSVTPDEIYISITISETDSKNKKSVEEQERQMVDAFKKIGINTEKDLTSSGISSDFNSYFLKGKTVEKTKSYQLKVGNAVMMTKVAGALEDIGIANVNVARVEYSGMKALKNILRSLAVKDAKQKAAALVDPLHQTVGKAIFVADNSVDNYTPVRNYAFKTMARASADVESAPLPEIDFQKIKVSSTVDVKFILQ